MTRLKLPIILFVVVLAAGAGLFMTGVIPGKGTASNLKKPVQPVMMPDEFIVNLANTDTEPFAKFKVALKPENMIEDQLKQWTGGDAGGHGAAGEAPGPAALSVYAPYRDAIIEAAGSFTYAELNATGGRKLLKQEILKRFDQIAQQDAAEAASGAKDSKDKADPTHPPFPVQDVYFLDFVIQN